VGIGFNLRVAATPGFPTLSAWCCQTIWLFSGAPEDPEYETVKEMQGADALYSAVTSVIHAIRTEDQNAQPDEAHQNIQL
jgi:hypothetical protein